MGCKCSSEKFIELDNVRLVDKGHGKGYAVLIWQPNKGSETVGVWREIYHNTSSKTFIQYIKNIDKHIEEEDLSNE